MPSDPKSGPRIVDLEALRRARLSGDECAACGAPPANVHHVIPKGAPYFGDDVPGNLLLICGSGTMRCHGAFHGSPYEATISYIQNDQAKLVERRDREWVARRIGLKILKRPDIVDYVSDKLGDGPGREYLRRVYYANVRILR